MASIPGYSGRGFVISLQSDGSVAGCIALHREGTADAIHVCTLYEMVMPSLVSSQGYVFMPGNLPIVPVQKMGRQKPREIH